MTTEIRNNGDRDVTVLVASEGKVLRRISDGFIAGKELWLGYSYYRLEDGENVLRDEPLAEIPEHYEEIDEPEPDTGPDAVQDVQ